jgi:uncharacterized surface anchored protein
MSRRIHQPKFKRHAMAPSTEPSDSFTRKRNPMTRRLAASAASAALIIGAGIMLTPSLTASAAVIPSAITSISTNAYVVASGDPVAFTCTWAVPDHSAAGDTFTMQLPPELSWSGLATFPLNNDAGDAVANAVVDANRLVTFTLTDFVATNPIDVHGDCGFTVIWTAATPTRTTDDLVFDVGASVIHVPVNVDPNAHVCDNCTSPQIDIPVKRMWWSDSNTQDLTDSYIGGQELTMDSNDVTIVDEPGAGLALVCDTTGPYRYYTYSGSHGWGADMHVQTPYDNDIYVPTVDCTPAKMTVHWTNLPAGEVYAVQVRSTVTDQSLAEYTNKATVTVNGESMTTSAETMHETASGTGTGTKTPTPSEPSTPTPSNSPSFPPNNGNSPLPPAATTPAKAVTEAQLAHTGSGLDITWIALGAATFLAGAALLAFSMRTRASGSRHILDQVRRT